VSALSKRELPDSFGAAEINGFHPRLIGDEETAGELRAALAEHAVICIRLDEALSEDGARAVASMLGPIKDPVGRTRDGGSMRYSEERQIIDAGFVLTDELRAQLGDLNFGGLDPQRPGLFETFHTDDTYTECPCAATWLHARDLPSGPGGDTCFIDMRATYRLLDPDEQARLRGRRAAYSYNNHGAFPPRIAAEGPFEALVDVSHPIVRAHPVNGRPSLYIDLDRATHIEGMDESDGRKLLQSLQDLAERDGPRYAHKWHENDVLVWDNASVQHKASGDFPLGEPRRFWRYMIAGPAPVAFDQP
jgi:alpha-ketoglutarate-dependent taurine dioxygenase